MFENSGEKIKSVSSLLFGIACFIAIFIVVFAISAAYNVPGGEFFAISLYIGAAIIVIVAWTSNLFLHAFGDLVDSTQKIFELLQSEINGNKGHVVNLEQTNKT